MKKINFVITLINLTYLNEPTVLNNILLGILMMKYTPLMEIF